MKIYAKTVLTQTVDYRMSHEAPCRDSGAPLHNASHLYPEDIYSPQAASYYWHYGRNNPDDKKTIDIIQKYHNRPNAMLTVYRAVPMQNEDLIEHYKKQQAYILKHGEMPQNADNIPVSNSSEYYDYTYDKIEELEKELNEQNIDINPGDWITINRNYAKEHGMSNLHGKYKIISKKVKASDIYTDADSIHEWGYDPS